MELRQVRAGRSHLWTDGARSTVLLIGLIAMGGCQAVFPAALPSRFGIGQDARIAKQAKADTFPTPADVGLTTPTSVP